MTLDLLTTYKVITCGHKGCGVTYAIPETMYTRLLNSHDSFWCPNGHCRVFLCESEAEKLRKQLLATQAKLDREQADSSWQRKQRERAERSAKALRGVVTRTKNRVCKGVCPCCNRYFECLKRHMATKHPSWSGKALERQEGGR